MALEKEVKGHIHPINQIIDQIVSILVDMDFQVVGGPEIDNEYYNFDALNVPKDHPARDMQDTFWLEKNTETNKLEHLLRTQTSNIQIHFMEGKQPPFKIVAPGKVYRYEATDKTHEVQFHQVEGLVVGENITLANLKFTLNAFLKKLYGDDIEIRLRPSFFPFVEPGIEVDIKRPGGKWLEVLGAGMVNPNVLNNVGINPKKYSGFAFGLGLDRMAMVKYGIDDIRYLYNGDLRFVNQF
jgi:phenylalanyl-tRNA synthetase alpha chain